MKSNNQFKHISKTQHGALMAMWTINDKISELSDQGVCASCILDYILDHNQTMIDNILEGKCSWK